MSVTVTEKAAKEVKRVMEEQGLKSDDSVLRVGVAGGGCSGFSYALTFESKEAVNVLNDITYEVDGLTTVVDRKADTYLDGTTVDFHDGLEKRGFTFRNPNAVRNCGCGSSFST